MSMPFLPPFRRPSESPAGQSAADRSTVDTTRSIPSPAERSDDRARSSGSEKSRRTKLLQGAVVFVVMFVGLYWLLSRRDAQTE